MKKKVFLGGTCNESTWRDRLIPMLNIDYFNPVVADWNEAAYQQELFQRQHCDFCLYVITPRLEGFYSIAEVVDDSNKRPEKTVFCCLLKDDTLEFNSKQVRSLAAIEKMIKNNGGKCFVSLETVAEYLNSQN